ncbi:Fructose-2,6-bisphosphatase [Verticillium dahliae VDG1]|nr:Fructose-2,6-bisphosphatase [Verticillium dahliae VDG1]
MASEKGVQPEVRRETKLSKETAETHPQKGKSVEDRNADVTLRLLEEHGDKFGPLTPEAEKKLRRKLYLRVMLLLSAVNIMLFVDKSTLGYAAILGLFEETGIRQTEYNNLNTMFYVGYLAFQWPGHYLMQRLPFGKYVATTVFCWSVIIFLHCVATRYAGLIVMRLALGAAEAVIVPAMEITIGMFFNRHEQSFLQPVLWITCQAAPMVTGFISYGLLWATGPVLPWKLLHIVTGGLTLLLAVWVWIDYPSNPAEARWLTLEEKVQVIRRVHAAQQSSIEQKRFKREQFVETLRDPVSWLFALQSFTLMFSNNLNYGQKNLITTVGNLVSPQIWVADNGPRFYGAWASMISVSWVGTPIILWIIRFILARRNAERLDLAVLDLTDLQNKQFIYPL